MSTWNCRIIYHDKEEHPWYGVHEVFYNEDGSVFGYTEDAVDITGETEENVKEYAQMIINDINHAPVLIESEIVIIDNHLYENDDGKSYSTLEELIKDLDALDI